MASGTSSRFCGRLGLPRPIPGGRPRRGGTRGVVHVLQLRRRRRAGLARRVPRRPRLRRRPRRVPSGPAGAPAPLARSRVAHRNASGCRAAALPLVAATAQFEAVINCAALSQPAACERDPAAAEAVNVPTRLLEALAAQRPGCLLIHISTDQVFAGTKAHWTERDACEPVNAYGRSKAAAEAHVRARWPNHAILRPSIIYGPPPPLPVGRPLFLQWLDGAVRGSEPVDLFQDEFRCPTLVFDIVRVCAALCARAGALPEGARTLNMGGPERLSRADMGAVVAAARGCAAAHLRRVPSASVARPVASPADISMDSSLLEASLGLRLTPFEAGVRRSLQLGP